MTKPGGASFTLTRFEITATELRNGDYFVDEHRGFISHVWGVEFRPDHYQYANGHAEPAIVGYAPGRGLCFGVDDKLVVYRIDAR